MTETHYPTGEQYVLASTDGRVTAEIVQVGAALRALAVDGVDLVPRYPLDIPAPAGSGMVLVPWPNRVRGGRWTQRGETRQLAITEPATGNASHGLLRFASYTAAAQSASSVTLAHPVVPQTGYPFHLGTSVTYVLDDAGLAVMHAVTNLGRDDAPVALGAHPYLCIGDVDTADLTLRASGSTRFVADEQKVPVAQEPVDAATDLRSGRRVGELDLDTAFGDLSPDPDGRVRTTLTAPDGRRVTLWQGRGFDYVQIFTTDRYPGHELALAVEPMTAPADALNSGRGLRWLAPGESWELEWGIDFDARPND
ncbi:aldose 1-epimerase family protein [Microbacterium sp. BK668]|uniref:aldose 1-epimerase family protein n=1 Tax=Microbacterium sp. BK668 TaxID=2512118 RepID=UPI00105B319D|nr:aldose 1-epimerase family protein [Microbacterium sp. BK668]TDN90877.1 aldose 1-epimerase [Microbacterium sp. BK668]